MAPAIPTTASDGSKSPSASRFRRNKNPLSSSTKPHPADIFNFNPVLSGIKKVASPAPSKEADGENSTGGGGKESTTAGGGGGGGLFPKSRELLGLLSSNNTAESSSSSSGQMFSTGFLGSRGTSPFIVENDSLSKDLGLGTPAPGGAERTSHNKSPFNFDDDYFGLESSNTLAETSSRMKFELPAFTIESKGLALRHSPSIKAFINAGGDDDEVSDEEDEFLKDTIKSENNAEEDSKAPLAPLPPSPTVKSTAVPLGVQPEFHTTLAGPIYVEYQNSPVRLIPPGLLLTPNHLGLEVSHGGFTIGQVLVAQASYKACLAGEFTILPGETFWILGVYSDGWGIGYRRVEKKAGKIPRERFYEREETAPKPVVNVDIALLAMLKDTEELKPEDLPCVKIIDKYTGTTSIHLAYEIGVFPLVAFRNSPVKGIPFKVLPALNPAAAYTGPYPAVAPVRRIKDDVIAPHRYASLNLSLIKSVVRGEAYAGYVPSEVARCLHMLCSAGRLKGEWWEEQRLMAVDGRRLLRMPLNSSVNAVAPITGKKENLQMGILAKEGGLEGEDMGWVRQRYAHESTITRILDEFTQVKASYLIPKDAELPGTEDQPPPTMIRKTLSRSASKLSSHFGSLRRTLSAHNNSQPSLGLRSRINARKDSLLNPASIPEVSEKEKSEERDPLQEVAEYLNVFPSRQNVNLLQQRYFPNSGGTLSSMGGIPPPPPIPRLPVPTSAFPTGAATLSSALMLDKSALSMHSTLVSRANTQISSSTAAAARRRRIPDDLFQPLLPEWNNGVGIVNGDAAQGGMVDEVLDYLKNLEGRIVKRFEGLEKVIAEAPVATTSTATTATTAVGGSQLRLTAKAAEQSTPSTPTKQLIVRPRTPGSGSPTKQLQPLKFEGKREEPEQEQKLLEWRRSRRSSSNLNPRTGGTPVAGGSGIKPPFVFPEIGRTGSPLATSVSVGVKNEKEKEGLKGESPGVVGWKRARNTGLSGAGVIGGTPDSTPINSNATAGTPTLPLTISGMGISKELALSPLSTLLPSTTSTSTSTSTLSATGAGAGKTLISPTGSILEKNTGPLDDAKIAEWKARRQQASTRGRKNRKMTVGGVGGEKEKGDEGKNGGGGGGVTLGIMGQMDTSTTPTAELMISKTLASEVGLREHHHGVVVGGGEGGEGDVSGFWGR